MKPRWDLVAVFFLGQWNSILLTFAGHPIQGALVQVGSLSIVAWGVHCEEKRCAKGEAS